MENLPLRYLGYTVAMQEVPMEISLIINISGCPHKCENCHSRYLWDYKGNFINTDLDKLLEHYKDFITCVCFMGGDQNVKELQEMLCKIKEKYNLKTCLYSGSDNPELFDDILHYLDYLKVGRYIEKLGGLTSSITNQNFYKVNGTKLTDITNLMR